MKKFNLYLIEICIGLILFCITHTISDSFEAGGIAGAIYVLIVDFLNDIFKEEHK